MQGPKRFFLRIVNGVIASFSDCSYFVLAMAFYSLESLNVKVKSTNICELEMALGVSFTDNLDFSFWPQHWLSIKYFVAFGNNPISSVCDLEIHCNASFTDNFNLFCFGCGTWLSIKYFGAFGNKPISSVRNSEIHCNASFTDNFNLFCFGSDTV